jgi:histidyl-tRNA synthetase
LLCPARAIGRAGSAASHLKRYEVGRVFHKSMAEGHPRETLEASFDVVHEDISLGSISEAETVVVASQILSLLPRRSLSVFRFEHHSPMWYLRVSNTRLADALLDLCGVPMRESTRRVCSQLLSRFTAPSPHCLRQHLATRKKSGARRSSSDAGSTPDLAGLLDTAVAEHGLPKPSADKLRLFIESCMPLPIDVWEAIEALRRGFSLLQGRDLTVDPKRSKRLEEAAKSLRSLNDTFSLLRTLRFEPLISRQQVSGDSSDTAMNVPLYVSIDLGLRQRRRHYHGGIIFQCVVLPDSYFDQIDPAEHNDALISASGRGFKVAEGGNFSDLVRKHRPPGNFGSAFANYYTTAPIPFCVGVRISVGRLVELLYNEAMGVVERSSLDGWNELLQKSSIDFQGLEILRQSLGHPLKYSETVQCIVSSVHGMDSASTKERFMVASRLWQEGISAEYLPQSGVMLSVLKRLRDDSSEGGASDWSLTELVGVCALLNIPFLVIVQPHLLRDKNSVRLRRFPYDVITQGSSGTSASSSNERFVPLDLLASTILRDVVSEEDTDEPGDAIAPAPSSLRDLSRSHNQRDVLPCILVEHDQYYSNDRDMYKSEVPQWKAHQKALRGISMSAQNYLSSLHGPASASAFGASGAASLSPVFAVADASFVVLRDFGTCLMKREAAEKSAIGAANETVERHPKHKRVIKTLGVAIDSYMRRQGLWSYSTSTSSSPSVPPSSSTRQDMSGGGYRMQQQQQQQQQQHQGQSGSSLVSLLLYSKVDDRFDLVTLSSASRNQSSSRRGGR